MSASMLSNLQLVLSLLMQAGQELPVTLNGAVIAA